MNHPVLDRAQAAFIARAAYVLAVIMVVLPLSDIAIGIAPLQFHSIRWRVGATGLVTGAMLLPLTGLFLAFSAAHFQQHRKTQYALSVLAALGALTMVAVLAFFVLDTLQLRNEVVVERRKMYDRATIKGIVSQALLLGFFVFVSIGSWRASRALTRAARTREKKAEPVVMGKHAETRGTTSMV